MAGPYVHVVLPAIATLVLVAAAAPAYADQTTGQTITDHNPPSLYGAPGGFDTLRWPIDIAMHDTANRTYAVVSGAEGIQIIDVTDPKSPSPTSSMFGDYAGLVYGPIHVEIVQISGRTYVAAAIGEGIRIIDVTDPAAPSHASSILNERGGFGNLTLAAGMAVAEISGSHYLLAASPVQGALLVAEITDPASPRQVSRAEDGQDGFDTLQEATDVETANISGGTYAVVVGAEGMQIIDITNPATPRPASAVQVGRDGFEALGRALDVQIAQIFDRTYALVASWDNGSVQVVDVTNPEHPRPAAGIFDGQDGFEALEGAADIEVVATSNRTYALVASLMDGLQVADVTEPDAPRPAAAMQLSGDWSPFEGLSDVEVFAISNRTYAAGSSHDRSSVEIIEVTDPASPSRISTVYDDRVVDHIFEDVLSLDVATVSGRPYAMSFTWRGDTLQLVDISNPADPVRVTSISGGYRGVLYDKPDVDAVNISNRTYAVASVWNDIRIINITDPSAPSQVAAVRDGQDGFEALDGACGLDSIVVSGRTYLAVAAEDDGAVQVMDMTDPAHPRPTADIFDDAGGFKTLSGACRVETAHIAGNTYAVVSGSEGIQFIDMANPSAPRPAAAVPAGQDGLYRPTDIDVVNISGRTYVLAVGSDLGAETGAYTSAIQIVEITDPSSPSLVASMTGGQDGLEAIGHPSDIEALVSPGGTYALVSSAYPGGSVQVIDITDPAHPRPAAAVSDDRKGFGSLGGAADIEVVVSPAGTYALIQGYDDRRVQVIDMGDPTHPRPVSGIAPDDPRMLDVYAGANGVGIFKASGGTYAAAVGTHDDAVQIVEITDPAHPRLISDTFFRGGPDVGFSDMEVITVSESERAYVLMTQGGFINVLDVTDPASPSREDSFSHNTRDMDVVNISGRPHLVAVGGTFEHGVLIADMADPARPVWVDEMVDGRDGFEALSGASGVDAAEISGRLYAAVASPLDDGIQIIDITHPADPLPAAAVFDGEAGFDTLAMASGVAMAEISGRMHAVVSGWEGIQIVDISSPSAPRPVAALVDGRDGFDLPAGKTGVDMVGVDGRTFVLVTGNVDGAVRAADITNPAVPVPVHISEVRSLFEEEARLGVATMVQMLGRTYALTGDGMRAVDITERHAGAVVVGYTVIP